MVDPTGLEGDAADIAVDATTNIDAEAITSLITATTGALSVNVLSFSLTSVQPYQKGRAELNFDLTVGAPSDRTTLIIDQLRSRESSAGGVTNSSNGFGEDAPPGTDFWWNPQYTPAANPGIDSQFYWAKNGSNDGATWNDKPGLGRVTATGIVDPTHYPIGYHALFITRVLTLARVPITALTTELLITSPNAQTPQKISYSSRKSTPAEQSMLP